jgi:hypothetical protein
MNRTRPALKIKYDTSADLARRKELAAKNREFFARLATQPRRTPRPAPKGMNR